MPEHVVDAQDALGGVEASGHRPLHVLGVADVDVVVDHGDHLERRERGEGGHDRLLRPAGARLPDGDDGVIEAASPVAEVDVVHPGDLALQHAEDVRLPEQPDRVPDLDPGEDGLEDRIRADMHRPHVDDGAGRAARVVAGDLREGTLLCELSRHDLALERVHRVRDHVYRQLLALDELQPRLVEDARNAELVGVRGSGLGRRGGREVQARADAAVDRERERLAPGAGLFEIELQVSAGVDVDVQGLLVDDHEALDRRVAHPGIGVAGDDHAGVEVRAAVLERMHRRRDAPQIDLDGLSFVDRAVPDHHRGDRPALPLLDAPGDELGQGVLVALHQVREQLPRPVQAGQHRRVVSLDVLEEHRSGSALEAGRDRRELQVRIDFRAYPHQTAHLVEVLDDAREVAQPVSCHGCRLHRGRAAV